MKQIVFVGSLAVGLFLFLYLRKNKEVTKSDGEAAKIISTGTGSTRGQRNNNPFNIRYNAANNWVGQLGSDGAFCVFDTMGHGVRAGGILLRNYLKQGNNTISKILTKFAPTSDNNNTSKYIADVEKMSGINKDVVLKNSDLWRIAVPMMYIESKYNATETDKVYFENA
ncbi:MAG: hypothetical protein J6Y35_03900 [Bacteroidales bacterium]|nr:hypothetical protein [Bacteroidales bacterium]